MTGASSNGNQCNRPGQSMKILESSVGIVDYCCCILHRNLSTICHVHRMSYAGSVKKEQVSIQILAELRNSAAPDCESLRYLSVYSNFEDEIHSCHS